jgi:hypothetical protein
VVLDFRPRFAVKHNTVQKVAGTLRVPSAYSQKALLFACYGTWNVPTSAPVKAIELSGESPDRGSRYRPVVNGNCVFNRKGGEQPKTKEQSVTVK